MHPILRNIISIIAGISTGLLLNMVILNIGYTIIPTPYDLDLTTPEGLKEALPFFEAKDYIFPFLAHAVSTLVAAFIAGLIAADGKMKFSLAVGFFFLLGGVANIVMLPSPLWFIISDMVLAYLPMAYFGGKYAIKIS